MAIDPELQRVSQDLRRWKNTATNIMDRYSDLLTAAGITGFSFFQEDIDDLHDIAVKRIEGIVRRRKVEPLGLPFPISEPRKNV